MNHCVKCVYPVSPGGYGYIVKNHCIVKICTFCESVEKNNCRVFKEEDILFLTGKCSECFEYISSDNEPTTGHHSRHLRSNAESNHGSSLGDYDG